VVWLITSSFGTETGFICLAYNHKKLYSLKISSSKSLALELEFLWDQFAWTLLNLNSSGTNWDLELASVAALRLFDLSRTTSYISWALQPWLSWTPLYSWTPELNSRCLSNLSSYGRATKYTDNAYFQKLLSILSVTAGNKPVSREVNICYRGHMLQQASNQWSSILVAAWTPLQTWRHNILGGRLTLQDVVAHGL
jgi:hypothetical protein